MNKFLAALLLSFLNYVVGFIILPFTVLKLGTEAGTIILLSLWLVVSAFWMRDRIKVRYLFIGILVTWLMILIYCPRGLYGIGTDGIMDFIPKELDALGISILFVIVQTGVILINRLVRTVCKK